MLRPASRGRVQGRDQSGFYSRGSYEQGATMQDIMPPSAVLAILWVLGELLVSKNVFYFFQLPFLIFEYVEDN